VSLLGTMGIEFMIPVLYGSLNWIIHLTQHRDQWQTLMNNMMKLLVSIEGRNFMNSWAALSFTVRKLLHGVMCINLVITYFECTVILTICKYIACKH
jgi:hypothetical protein